MARDRRLPGMLARVSTRFGTPSGAIAFLMLIQVLLIAASEWWDGLFALEGLPHYFSLFVWCSTFGAFALLVVYFLMSLGAIRAVADDPNKAGLVVAIVLGLAISGAGIFGSFYKVPSPTLLAPWYAVIWFVLAVIAMVVWKGRAPASKVLADLRSGGDA